MRMHDPTTEINSTIDISKRSTLASLPNQIGEDVILTGWVSVARKQKAVQFLILRDGTQTVQLVNDRAANPRVSDIIDALHLESVVAIRGVVEADPRIKLNGLEVRITDLEVLSVAEDIPIGKDAGLDVRLDWRFLDLRSPRNQLLLRVQTSVQATFREFCIGKGMVEINSPKLMPSPSESRSELFEVKYFDRKAYLAQSPQFYKQMGIAAGLPGVFETGPVFRANPSFTSRHDTEFTSIDVEIPWVSSHETVMEFEEQLLHRVLEVVASAYGEQIQSEYDMPVVIPELPFPRVSHAEAMRLVSEDGYEVTRADGDLDPESERRLARIIKEKTGHDFVFVTDYPSGVRPFYHMRDPDDPTSTRSFDLLWRGLEITTGAQREHRPDVLRNQVVEKGLDPEGLSSYLDFFRFGCPPHGGFGLGLTRVLMILLGEANVREVTYLYRGPNRLTP